MLKLKRRHVNYYRIEVQDLIRRSSKDPNENDQRDVDKMCHVIIAQFAMLDRLQPSTTSAVQSTDTSHDSREESKFDNLDDEIDPNLSGNDQGLPASTDETEHDAIDGSADNILRPERKILPIPSQSISDGNVYRKAELDLRLVQATKILTALRDLIAEKSFQFSHVIRVAPRKGVRTRARSAIAKINNHIAYHCRVYDRCRAAILKLGANETTLNKFRSLQRQDLASSTALLNPNEPGSSNHRLSWIWLSGRTADDQDSLGLQECKFFYHLPIHHIMIL